MTNYISAKLLSAPCDNWYLGLTRKLAHITHLSFKFRYFTWLTDKSFLLRSLVTGNKVIRIDILVLYNQVALRDISKEDV